MDTHVHISVHVDEILVWTWVSPVKAPPVIETLYALEHCILKPMIIHCSIAMVVNTQETDTDRWKCVSPNNGL